MLKGKRKEAVMDRIRQKLETERRKLEMEKMKKERQIKERIYGRRQEIKKGTFGRAIVRGFKGKQIKRSRRAIGRRREGALRALGALGITDQRGRGRPRGTFKYGMPIHEYKRKQSQKSALYQKYQEDKMRELARRGLTPEAVRQMQYQRTMEEGIDIPIQTDFEDTPERVMNVADDELRFTKWRADKTISPNTQAILQRLRRTQLKGQRDNIEMQRRLKERRMVASAGNLLKTPFIFKDNTLDVTGVSQENILMAPNVFEEDPEDFILKTKRFNILQTGEAGNNLKF